MGRIRVVLCRPIYPRNVGMCARSLANMGVDDLIIVASRAKLGIKARQGAAHAQHVLRNARVYESFDEFKAKEGEGLRIALSGRDGQLNKPTYLNEAIESFRAEPEHLFNSAPIYLILGPEDDGLSNEEMDICHHVCRLPTFGTITSMNLSHACMLTVFMVQTALGHETRSVAIESTEPVYYPRDTIRSWLEALGFDLSSKRVNIEKTFNRILLSRSPSGDELRLLDSVLQQTVRKLRAGPKS